VTATRSADGIRAELTSVLQETDPHRPLDSLETVVVLTRLRRHGLEPDMPPLERPGTIEGWVTWAVRRSSAS
jgi:aryl carrier-like protein